MYELRQIVKDFYGVTRAKQGLKSLRELAPHFQILEFLPCKWAFRCCSFIMSQQIPSFPKFINFFWWHHYLRTLYKQYCHLQLHVCLYLDGYSLPLHMIYSSLHIMDHHHTKRPTFLRKNWKNLQLTGDPKLWPVSWAKVIWETFWATCLP